MIYLFEFLIFILLLGLWWFKNDREKYAKYPPGPLRIPILGNILQVATKSNLPAVAFKKLAETYGDTMFLKMGRDETVVFSSNDSVREILLHESAVGRTQFEFIRDRHENKNRGIIWGHSLPWQNLRRFTVRNLRDYGFGKSAEMDVVVNDELEKFIEHISEESSRAPGNILHVEDMFNLTMVNVLWRLVSGKSYGYNDSKMLRLLKLNDDFFQSTNLGMDITHLFPVLRDWFPNWAGRTVQIECSKALFSYGKELLEEHRRLLSTQSEPECFIDVFAAKVEQSKDDPDTDFNEEQFVFTILDLLIGGSETSSKTLTFGILYMLLNPDVQEKIQQEIDREVPPGMPLDTSMKSRLPYTTASVLEMLRYSSILAIPSAREATEDFYFRGYFIKKGTALMQNIYAAHHSDELWGDPQNFRPERFLNASGTAIEKKTADKLVSFGAGKRFCLGQSLAETTSFIYFATMVRNFKFVKVPGTNPTTVPKLAMTSSPYPFDVKVVRRNVGRKSSFA